MMHSRDERIDNLKLSPEGCSSLDYMPVRSNKVSKAFNSPLVPAMLYAALASSTTIASAYLHCVFFDEHLAIVGIKHGVSHPHVLSVFTLLDLLVVNPLIIYILTKNTVFEKKACEAIGVKEIVSRSQQTLIMVICILLGILSMVLYLKGAICSTDFDIQGVVAIHDIAATEFSIFIWMSFFISFVYYHFFQHIFCLFTVIDKKSVSYDSFHQDGRAGCKHFVKPIFTLLSAMTILFIMLVIYFLQGVHVFDKVDNKIFILVFYVAVIVPTTFLYLFHLYRMVISQKDKWLCQAIDDEPKER